MHLLSLVLAQAAPGSPIVNDAAPNDLKDLELVFGKVLQAAIPLAGIVLFIVLIMGGISLMTAGDDPQKAAGAKSTVTYAIYGIVFIAAAYLILRLIALVTGVDSILTFVIRA